MWRKGSYATSSPPLQLHCCHNPCTHDEPDLPAWPCCLLQSMTRSLAASSRLPATLAVQYALMPALGYAAAQLLGLPLALAVWWVNGLPAMFCFTGLQASQGFYAAWISDLRYLCACSLARPRQNCGPVSKAVVQAWAVPLALAACAWPAEPWAAWLQGSSTAAQQMPSPRAGQPRRQQQLLQPNAR